MCKEHIGRSEILSKVAGHRASKSQLPVFYISGTMIANDFPWAPRQILLSLQDIWVFLKEINGFNFFVLHPQNFLARVTRGWDVDEQITF